MTNYKRKKPKNNRSGCLMCKPHKMNGNSERSIQNQVNDALLAEQLEVSDLDVTKELDAMACFKCGRIVDEYCKCEDSDHIDIYLYDIK